LDRSAFFCRPARGEAHVVRAAPEKLTKIKETKPKPLGRCAHPPDIGAASMTIVLAIAGWVLISTVCTPLIGRFLHTLGPAPMQPAPQAKARSAVGPGRRDGSRRRHAVNEWPRTT